MPGKKSNNKSGAALDKRLRKSVEAEARQRTHDSLTTEQKLAKIAKRRGQSSRERERLLAGA
jgi:hypothetical protein